MTTRKSARSETAVKLAKQISKKLLQPRMGRPPLHESLKRMYAVHLRLTAEERELIDEARGIHPETGWIRDAALAHARDVLEKNKK
jgi:hypothetical protein